MISEEACSRPARVNSISSARLNLASAATRSSCLVSAAATRSGGYRPRSACASSERTGPGRPRSPASRPSNSRPSGDSEGHRHGPVPPPHRPSGLRVNSARWSGRPTIEDMSLDFPAFALSPEHEALRESVRALADEKIAPHAAKVDQPPSSRRRRTTRWSRPTCTPCTSPRSTAAPARTRSRPRS